MAAIALWPEGGPNVLAALAATRSATQSATLKKKNKSNSADDGLLLMEIRMPNVILTEVADHIRCIAMEMPMDRPYHITQYTGDRQQSGTRSAYAHLHHMVSQTAGKPANVC